jgi:outer membrane protein OmpA-like peptidoglycan-associated protein
MMKKIIILFILSTISFGVFADKGIDGEIKKANELFDNLAYSEAVKLFLDIENKGFGSLETKLKIAECYRLQKDYVRAEEWYEKFAKTGMVKNEYIFNYAEILRNNGKYEEAKIWYEKYSMINAKGKVYVDYCNTFSKPKIDTNFKVKNVINLNSKNDDFGPSFYNEGLVFTSARGSDSKGKSSDYLWNGQPWLDVFQINEIPKGMATKDIQSIKGLVNTDMHEGPVTFTDEGKTMYFTRNNYINKKKTKASDNKTIKLSIFSAEWDGSQWINIKPFKYNNAEYSCGHPTISNDGERMYFASDMPNGYGGSDIYVTYKQGESWGEPINLGSLVNTDKNELFPFITTTNELYYSSEGLPGYGGLDIFKAKQNEDDEWQPPVNLNSPINSSYDDFSYIYDEPNGFGFFASNRKNGTGGDDIYYVYDAIKEKFNKKKKECFKIVEGYVIDEKTGKKISNASVIVYTVEDNSNVFETTSDSLGFYSLKVPCDYDSLTVVFTDAKYFTKKLGINPKTDNSPLSKDVLLERIVIDKPIIVKNIYYDLDKFFIRNDASIELDKLSKFLLDNPTVLIELSSHTDSRGSDEYNLTLSENRAKSAVAYLIEKGINLGRLYPKGYGETKLVNECDNNIKCNEDQHQQNRRTEFRVIGYDKVIYADSGAAKVEKIFLSSDYQVNSGALVAYKIQLGVLSKPNEIFSEYLSDLGVVSYEITPESKYKYFLGTYSNYATASSFLQKVKKRNMQDVFLVPYYKGKQISLEDALKFEK